MLNSDKLKVGNPELVWKVRNPALIFGSLCALLFVWQLLDFWAQREREIPMPAITGRILANPVTLEAFELFDQHGKSFTDRDLKGHWSLLFFGFASCPHICPVHMSQVTKFYRRLEADTMGELPQVVFVSVDPERDTRVVLEKYIDNFHPDFIAATGAERALLRLESLLRIGHKRGVTKPNGFYFMDHSSLVHLIDPEGQYVASFEPPFHPDTLRRDYELTLVYLSKGAESRMD